MDWTLVRVAGLTNKAKSNNVKSGYLGHGIIGFSTSRADMADFILNQVANPAYIQQAPAISS
ncbi:MAG: NAD(P)H-binding protein [Chitinophaga sp.]|nr:NAD(P)H-binding protein [Chitinophaga sp.]